MISAVCRKSIRSVPKIQNKTTEGVRVFHISFRALGSCNFGLGGRYKYISNRVTPFTLTRWRVPDTQIVAQKWNLLNMNINLVLDQYNIARRGINACNRCRDVCILYLTVSDGYTLYNWNIYIFCFLIGFFLLCNILGVTVCQTLARQCNTLAFFRFAFFLF